MDRLLSLEWSLRALAQPGEVQRTLFPPLVVVADELALEFHNWYTTVTQGAFGLSLQQVNSLKALDLALSRMTDDDPSRWTDDALLHHPAWNSVRQLARDAIHAFGWTELAPPVGVRRGQLTFQASGRRGLTAYDRAVDDRFDSVALDDETRPVTGRPVGLRLRAAYLESYIGAAFAIFLVVPSGILGLSYAMEVRRHGIWDTLLFVGALLGGTFLDLPYFWRLWSEIARDNPRAVLTVALRQPRAAAPLRPIIAIWWLSHFAAGGVFAFWCERLSAAADLTWAGVLPLLAWLFLSFGGAYAANGFLAMAVGAISASERTVEAVWRYRILLDLCIAIAACIVALVWGIPAT